MSLITKVEKILCNDVIDWDNVRLIIPNCSNMLLDKLLLGVVNRKDVPNDVVRLLAGKARLKTVRRAFDKACCEDGVPNAILDILLKELEPLTPEIMELCLRSSLRSNRSEVITSLIHQDQDFLSSNFAMSAFEDETDFKLLADMLIRTDIIRQKKDMMSKGNMIHQFVSGPESIDVVSVILDAFPSTVALEDDEGKIPLHYALKSNYFSLASFLITIGVKQGLHLGGLLKKCKYESISPLTCALEDESSQDSISMKTHIRNIVEWLLTLKLLHDDACVSSEIIRFLLDSNFVDVAGDVYNEALELNVPDIQNIILRDISEDMIRRGNLHSYVAFICENKFDDSSTSCLDSIFNILVSRKNISGVRLLLRSYPILLWSPSLNNKGLPIHTAFMIDSLPMVLFLFEEAMKSDTFPFEHGGIFTENLENKWDNGVVHPILFDSNGVIQLERLRRMINIDPKLPIIPYALKNDVSIDDTFFLHPSLNWDPLSQFEGRHALFYALSSLQKSIQMGGLKDPNLLLFIDLCLNNDSKWHKCIDSRNSAGQLPLHFALESNATVLDQVMRKFLLNSCNLKYLSDIDNKSGLYPALLAASYCDVATTYELIRLNVQVIAQF